MLAFLMNIKKRKNRKARQSGISDTSPQIPISKPRHQKRSGNNKGEFVSFVFTANPENVTIPGRYQNLLFKKLAKTF